MEFEEIFKMIEILFEEVNKEIKEIKKIQNNNSDEIKSIRDKIFNIETRIEKNKENKHIPSIVFSENDSVSTSFLENKIVNLEKNIEVILNEISSIKKTNSDFNSDIFKNLHESLSLIINKNLEIFSENFVTIKYLENRKEILCKKCL